DVRTIVNRACIQRKTGVPESIPIRVSARVTCVADAVVVTVLLPGVRNRRAVVHPREDAVAVRIEIGNINATRILWRSARILKMRAGEESPAPQPARVGDPGDAAAKMRAILSIDRFCIAHPRPRRT